MDGRSTAAAGRGNYGVHGLEGERVVSASTARTDHMYSGEAGHHE
jgi:hypothetical protein